MDTPISFDTGLTVSEPTILGIFCIILIVYTASMFYHRRHAAHHQAAPVILSYCRLVDQSVESGSTIWLMMSHKGLGIPIIESSPAFPLLECSLQRMQGTGRVPFIQSADGIIAAAAMGDGESAGQPAQPASAEVYYTGPDAFLSAANTALYCQGGHNLVYSFGQATLESLLLEQGETSMGTIRGGASAPLAGLLLSEHPEEAVMAEDYYVTPCIEGKNPTWLACKWLHSIILLVVIIGLALILVGYLPHA